MQSVVSIRPAIDAALGKSPEGDRLERIKASIRAKVEHPFDVVKNLLLHRKACYRGLVKTLNFQ